MARISIDNGSTFCTPEEAVKGMPWEQIVNLMDDEVREKVHNAAWYFNEVAFLKAYLKAADEDLIIG